METGAVIQPDRAPDDSRVCAEATPPDRVAQHDDLVSTFDFVMACERAAESGSNANDIEESGSEKEPTIRRRWTRLGRESL